MLCTLGKHVEVRDTNIYIVYIYMYIQYITIDVIICIYNIYIYIRYMIVFTLAYIKIAGTMKGSRGHFFPTSRIHDDLCS